MKIVTPALLYFSLVFGAGFVLGTIRVLLGAPLVGERAAELIEVPLMLGVIALAARWIVRHLLPDRSTSVTLSVGIFATGLVLVADILVGVTLRNMNVSEIFLDRDPITGAAYYLSLLAFTIMPWLLARRAQS